eukprot:TRINITY_DN16670_c0_g1_i1.p2 TRINITY_DN16670_c0_g1~~TRINITY_DN16670_c0_g1_i1.p2  ORF type:complete len:246 (+),score=90.95 TRINITY_DN16670_c0_g1_i1:80-817(+)
MKLNIANPSTGCQKLIEVEEERKLVHLYDKRISQEVSGDPLGDQFKGYVFRITGGNDKQGFPMKQGVLVASRVRLLLNKDSGCYRPKRTGERRRKSVRGCIVGPDLAVINLVIVKKGPEDLPDLTDKYNDRRLGPKRASKIRKMFKLTKDDDVRKFVVRRELKVKDGKKYAQTKAPKIQRLVTPLVRQRKRRRLAVKVAAQLKAKTAAADYAKLLAQRNKDRRQQLTSKKSTKKSTKKSVKSVKA